MCVSAVASLAKWLVFARLLGADQFSYYATLDLVAAYGAYAGGLGLIDGTGRDVAYLRGAGRLRRATIIAVHAVGTLIVLSTAVLIAFLAIVWTTVDDRTLAITLTLGSVFAVINNLFLISIALVLARGDSVTYAVLMVAKNAGALALGVAVAAPFGLWGVLAAETGIVAALALWCLKPGRLVPTIRLGRLFIVRGVFWTGIPLMFGNLMQNVARSLDRILIGAAIGLGTFGQYSFAMTLALGGTVALNILARYITPRLAFHHGAASDLRVMRRQIDILSLAAIAAAAVGYPVLLVLIDRLGPMVLPEFALGLSLMPIVYWGAALQVFQLNQGFLIARGEGWRLTAQATVVALFSAGLCGAGLLADAEISYYAWVFVAHRLLAAILVRLAAGRDAAP